jgi:hypothetical protein
VAEKEALAQDTEEAARRKEAEAEERKKQSHEMVAESIRRELAESLSSLCVERRSADRYHLQRSRRRTFLTLTIRTDLTPSLSSKHGVSVSSDASNARRKRKCAEKRSGRRSKGDGPYPKNSGSRRIWSMPRSLARTSQRDSRSSYRSTGTRELSTRFGPSLS